MSLIAQTAVVVLEVRNDKDRGNLVVTITPDQGAVHFFKYHHQPLGQHPEQIQQLVQMSKPTIRTKSIKIDIMPFLSEYWNVSKNVLEFKGVSLNSATQQVLKVEDRRINKEIGIMKRKKTIQETKEAKKVEKRSKILQKLEADETKFQEERARRIREAMADMETN